MHLLVEIRCRHGTHMDQKAGTDPAKGGGVNKSSGFDRFMFMFMRHVHEAVFMKPMHVHEAPLATRRWPNILTQGVEGERVIVTVSSSTPL